MHIGGLIRRLDVLNMRSHDGLVDRQGMTNQQLGVLNALYEKRGKGITPNQRMLEKHLFLSNPTAPGLLDRLEAKGMIERVRDKDDARSKRIVITQAGVQCRMRVHLKLDEAERRLTQSLSPTEKEHLREMLRMIGDLEQGEEQKERKSRA